MATCNTCFGWGMLRKNGERIKKEEEKKIYKLIKCPDCKGTGEII
jgi:DnaJ-class molecular chaperone